MRVMKKRIQSYNPVHHRSSVVRESGGLEGPHGRNHHGHHHPVPASIDQSHQRPLSGSRGGGGGGSGTGAAVVGGRAISQSPVDNDLLGAIDIGHPHHGRVARLSTVEQGLVVGAVVVIITAALLVLFTETDHGQRLVLVVGVIVIVVSMGVIVSIRAREPDTGEERQCCCWQEERRNARCGSGAGGVR